MAGCGFALSDAKVGFHGVAVCPLGTDAKAQRIVSARPCKVGTAQLCRAPITSVQGLIVGGPDGKWPRSPLGIHTGRSEERRGGNECVSKGRSGWSRYP